MLRSLLTVWMLDREPEGRDEGICNYRTRRQGGRGALAGKLAQGPGLMSSD